MATPRLGQALLALTLCAAAVANPHGQSLSVMIGARPAPNQTWRQKTTQEMEFHVTPEAGGPVGASHITMAFTTTTRHRVGEPDAADRLPIELVFEDITQQTTVNGQPASGAAETIAGLKGSSMTLWLDSSHRIVDLKADKIPLAGDQLKGMVSQMFAAIPHQQMTVGETVSTPLSLPVPIPLPGIAPGANTLVGESRTTLVAVRDEDGRQLATLKQTIGGALDTTVEVSQVRLKLRFSVEGGGAFETDLRTGLVRGSQSTSKIEGRVEAIGGGPRPTMTMRGTSRRNVEQLP